MTFDEALEQFLSERREAARKLAAQAMKQFASWYLGTTGEALSLDNWTPQDTNEWLSYLLTTKHRTPNTINSYRSQLRAFTAWCVDERLLSRDPNRKAHKIQQQPKPVVALERTEENRLLRELEQEDPIYRFIILFLKHTGLRNSELAHLALRDITLGEKGLTLDQLTDLKPSSYRSGMLYVRSGKGMKAREVDLNTTAREVLLEYLAVRPKVESDQLLISLKTREPMTMWGIGYACKRLRGRTGIHIHPHLLRRDFATKLARNVPIEVVADLLGHSNVNTTRTNYLATDTQRRQRAVESIEE